jgi:hypothetical protein
MATIVLSKNYPITSSLIKSLGSPNKSALLGNFWKMAAIGQMIFSPLSNLGLCATGFKEIFLDKLVKPGMPAYTPSNNRIIAAVQWLFNLIRQDSSTPSERIQHMAHGGLYVASGACGLVYGLNVLNVIKLGKMSHVFNQFSNGLFMMANLVLLDSYIKSFLEASKTSVQGTVAQQANAVYVKRSAILGMLNCLTYIFMASLNLMGLFPTVALLVGCLGGFFSVVKILYDFYYSKNLATV